ncbi:Calcineurin-like phosphoesterase family protein [Desulfonema limicola]|uniref:Calcineurin-like phosphoesterase family protein n=1 Tax=Desulfonema limicola TaxID=45656 RepID=A0A975BDX0_9BACT|nr:metallophosphoesterase family protein [Desulfonema limicola]QTA83656.1 Calcineurin-like phosphoesterase family protein [Desulfonema limicola]
MKNFFAVGDIHGCYDKLKSLMEILDNHIDPDSDTIIFLGDYIDRGPNSFEVVEYLVNLKERFKNTVFLKGNHEEMLEQYLAGLDKYTYLVNGGQQTLESYMEKNNSGDSPIPRTHINFFSSLSLFFETRDYIFVHAGLKEKTSVENQISDDLLWIRGKFLHSNYNFGKKVVFGHTPFPEPLVQDNKIGIDTGAVYGNKLTCVKLPQLEFYQV